MKGRRGVPKIKEKFYKSSCLLEKKKLKKIVKNKILSQKQNKSINVSNLRSMDCTLDHIISLKYLHVCVFSILLKLIFPILFQIVILICGLNSLEQYCPTEM